MGQDCGDSTKMSTKPHIAQASRSVFLSGADKANQTARILTTPSVLVPPPQQVTEGHEWLVGGQCCSDLDPVLVTGTWDSSSERPAGLTQAATRPTALPGTRGSSSSPAGRRHRPSAAQHFG